MLNISTKTHKPFQTVIERVPFDKIHYKKRTIVSNSPFQYYDVKLL